jgi:hypothetical protein
MTDWGSVSSWIALVGALAAVLAYLSNRRDAVRATAARTYPVVIAHSYHDESLPQPDRRTRIEVRNDSDLPAFNLSVSVWQHGHARVTWRIRKHEDWWTAPRVGQEVATFVGPHSVLDPIELPAVASPGPKVEALVAPPVMLILRDGTGRDWIRWPNGRLTRLRLSKRIR